LLTAILKTRGLRATYPVHRCAESEGAPLLRDMAVDVEA